MQGTKEVLYKAAVEMFNPDCNGETHKRHLGFPARSAGKCALGRTGDLSRQAEVRASLLRKLMRHEMGWKAMTLPAGG